MKTCSTCKEVKSKSEFGKNKRNNNGLRSSCRLCDNLYYRDNKEQLAEKSKIYRQYNKEQIAEKGKLYREANKEQIAEVRKVYYESNKEQIKLYREANKEQIAEVSKVYYDANKEQMAEKSKIYRQYNKEQLAEKRKVYYGANKEQLSNYKKLYREINKEQIAENAKRYRQANPDMFAAIKHKRRALKLNSGGTFTSDDIQTLLLDQQGHCLYCNTTLILQGKGRFHVDHRMPLYLGGTNFPNNLQLLCPTCNHTKSATHPDIYESKINFQKGA